MDLRIGQVSVDSPRLQVITTPRSDVALPQVTLNIRRAGDGEDYATYTPIEVLGSTVTFEFDSLLFDALYGRYLGTLQFNGIPYASLEFQYTPNTSINPALQVSTTKPYQNTSDYATANYSGTGVSGPGTFPGLKDTPGSYAGAAGLAVFVNPTETGLQFRAGLTTLRAIADIASLPLAPDNPYVVLMFGSPPKPVYSDGASWRYMSDDSVVS